MADSCIIHYMHLKNWVYCLYRHKNRWKNAQKKKEEKLGKEYLQNHKLQCDPNPDDFVARIVKEKSSLKVKLEIYYQTFGFFIWNINIFFYLYGI